MTILEYKKYKVIVVNMRVGDKWFYTDYESFNGKFAGKDYIYKLLANYFETNYRNEDEEE